MAASSIAQRTRRPFRVPARLPGQPIDRDGNAPSLRMEFNTSNRFAAHALSRPPGRAVAVLSYDKRGVGTSLPAGRGRNFYYQVGMRDLVADAVEAVRFLSCHPRV